MSRFVVDASVAIKWYLPEPNSEDADRLLSGGFQLLAPDLLVSEVGNILWKRVMRSEITLPQAQAILQALESVPMTLQSASTLAGTAVKIASSLNRTFYDSLYLALALVADAKLVTADRKLFDAVKDAAPFKKHVLWIADIPVKG